MIGNPAAAGRTVLAPTARKRHHARLGDTGECALRSLIRLLAALTAAATSTAAVAGDASAAGNAGWFSLLPPLVAIVAALWWRSVLPALFVGLWVGAWGIAGLNPAGLVQGLIDAFAVYSRGALADSDHAAVILFSLMIGGLVGIISYNGGTRGIVSRMARWARDARRGQLSTAGLGLLLFIDDYANTLVVGNTMRPLSDRLRISREKLAYLVDSTAAPVSAVALVTTWIGYQVGLLDEALAGLEGVTLSGYWLLLQSLAYSFYPWLALVLVFGIAHSGRDFGPMLAAERRARAAAPPPAASAPSDDDAGRPLNALVPLAVLVFGMLAGLAITGDGSNLREIVGSADAYAALLGSSLVAVLTAVTISRAQGMPVAEILDAWLDGAHAILLPMLILILAWALSDTTAQLGTADFLVSLLGDWLPAALLPSLVFLLAGATAFATGTSWGTMGVLTPLVLPLALALAGEQGAILPASVAAVMAGAVWGDHCSPISDTTVLSSMSSGCDHIEHVRTQLPYAMLAGAASLLLGFLPVGFGLPWWLALGLGIIVTLAVLRIVGQRVADRSD